MSIHDDIRRGLAGGLTEDALLEITRLIANHKGNGEVARPIVLHTVLTVLEGTWRRWFANYPSTVELATALGARIIPAVHAVLAADEQKSPQLLSALDDLASTYRLHIRQFQV